MSDNYEDLANRSFDEIPEEKILPTGSWLLKARSGTIQPPKEAGKPETVLLVYTPVEPMDDVDAEEISALHNGSEYDYNMNRIFVRFYLESGRDVRNVREHLAKHGVTEGKNIKELLKNFRGTQAVAQVGYRQFQNSLGQTIEENTATNFVPAE
jgi:hypothetical protein